MSVRQLSHWQAATVLRRILRRFLRTWTRIPEAARHAWLIALAWGWAATGAVMAVVAWTMQRLEDAGRLGWEAPLLEWLERDLPLSFGFALLLDGLSNPVPLVLITVFLALFAAWEGRPLRALSFLAAFFCMALVVFLGWGIWDRARPTVILEGIGSPGAAFQSFPSGHLAQATAVYGMAAYLWFRASRSVAERTLVSLGMVVFLVMLSLGRLRVGAHWPSDVVGGALMGGLWVAALAVALHRAASVSAAAAAAPSPSPQRSSSSRLPPISDPAPGT
ncbi:hypothetical protein BH24GEM3_BH24GEM3_21120 [soil metagenome]